MINDQVTNGIIIGLIPALVFLGIVLHLVVNKQAARDATAALSDTAPIVPVVPLFTADFDIVVEVGGVKYRVFFAVADVRMIEGE